MDTTALLVKMLPASCLPYLKFIVTVLGGAASSVLATYPNADHRYAIAAAVLTAVGTYLTPNVQPVAAVGVVAKQEDVPVEYYRGEATCCKPNKEADPAEKPEPAPVKVQTQAPKVTEVGV